MPNIFFRNAHLNTIWSNKIRTVPIFNYQRFKIDTSDGDFLAIDWINKSENKAVILVHGLEGSSTSTYIKSITQHLTSKNYSVFCLNLRGCSGSPNNSTSSYHSGRTEDLETIVSYIIKNNQFKTIDLIGFSLGGNLVLKYLGEQNRKIINKAAVISVPCDLKSSCLKIQKGFNIVYNQKFIQSLLPKISEKTKQFPEMGITQEQINSIKNLYDFDNLYTAIFHGFKNADDYYKKCSSKQFILSIQTPSLIINALDDPFLTASCFPFEESKNNSNIKFLTPKYGGHVGFMSSFKDEILWHEKQILEFL